MKAATTLLLLSLSKPTKAFIPQCKFSTPRKTKLHQEAPQQKLSSSEIAERARQVAQDSAPPKLFDEDLLEDIRNCVQMLDRRVTKGPGSLSVEEVSKFEAATKRIVEEMNANLAQTGGSSHAVAPASAPAPELSRTEGVAQPSLTATVPVTPPAPVAPTPPVTARERVAKQLEPASVTDISMDDEGIPAFNAETSGFGLARGTANTYIIPGMEEMSPEEYRAALQKSVMDRQQQRKERYGGVVGNRAAHSYLDSLGWGGASKSLGVGKDVDEEGEGENDKSDEGGQKKKWTAY